MLYIEKFHTTGNKIFYDGNDRHYIIERNEVCKTSYTLCVVTLNTGKEYHAEYFVASTISAAIANIEALENGEKI